MAKYFELHPDKTVEKLAANMNGFMAVLDYQPRIVPKEHVKNVDSWYKGYDEAKAKLNSS